MNIPRQRNIFKPLTNNSYDFLKLSFITYLDNTIEKTYEVVKEAGFRNKNNQPHAPSTLYLKAKLFVIEYPEEARKEYIKRGFYLDDYEWYELLIFIAIRQYRGKDQFIRWALKSGIYKKAFHMFKKHFRLSDEDYNAFDDLLGENKDESLES